MIIIATWRHEGDFYSCIGRLRQSPNSIIPVTSLLVVVFCSLTEVYFLGFSWWSKEGGSRNVPKACDVSVAWALGADVATFGDFLNNAEIKWSRKVPFGKDSKRSQN